MRNESGQEVFFRSKFALKSSPKTTEKQKNQFCKVKEKSKKQVDKIIRKVLLNNKKIK